MAKPPEVNVLSDVDRPKWLELGATVKYRGVTRRICGIRPGKTEWEIMPASAAKWFPISKVEFVAPPDPDYRPWPASGVRTVM